MRVAREWARMGANSGRRKAEQMTSDFHHEKHELHEKGGVNPRSLRKNSGGEGRDGSAESLGQGIGTRVMLEI